MIAAWILTGTSLLMAVAAIYAAYRWREAYCQAYGMFDKYRKFINGGAKYMRITQSLDDNFDAEAVNVEVLNDVDGLSFVLKTLRCDPNDEEDIQFAIREAEELIETIQKA